jgi:CheY-like chemotaxis protein
MTKISILLVDDQPFVGMALGRLLASESDLELHCCTDANAAVAEANRLAPALILQDLVMPHIDGLTLVQLFRANPATAATPVVVLSGNDDAETRARARAAGATDYLVKLPAKGDLVACIRRLGSGGPQAAALDAAALNAAVTLDAAVLLTFRQGPPAMASFTAGLIDQFIVEAESRVETLHEAARRHDTDALKSTAHSLKGSSMIMGAQRLGVLCAEIEDGLAAAGGITPTLMTAIECELAQVRIAFTEERQQILSLGTPQS